MKILLTGANGQVGNCFQGVIKKANQENKTVELLATDYEQLDITNLDAVTAMVNDFCPDVIVNAAAYTAVDKAETDTELAYAVNELGPKNLAIAANNIGSAIVHISTDYVFDGTATAPYLPDEQTNPQSVYGESKLAGELAVQAANSKHIIIRTAWVFSEYGNNFVKTMINLAKTRDKLSIVADQYGCPTYAGDIAASIYQICTQLEQSKSLFGTYHYCGDLPTSWHGFARAIFADALEQGLIDKIPELRAINTDEYPLPAPRPAYSVLNTEALTAINIPPCNWRKQLTKVLHTRVF